MYERLQRLVLPDAAVIDISDADDTTQYTYKPSVPMVVYGWGGICVTETVGTVTETGHGGLYHGTTLLSTITPATGQTVGTEVQAADISGGPVKVAAGESLVFKTKNQEAIAGELRPFLWVEEFPDIQGAE